MRGNKKVKNILIGCPYTGLLNIKKAIEESSQAENIYLITTDQITRFSHKGLYLSDKFLSIKEIHSSFIRYPYDLSPLHSQNYILREEIEYYKSIALLFDSVGVNSLKETWVLRNRLYSLSQIELFGANVPEFWLSNSPNTDFLDNNWMIKAIGNCYVAKSRWRLSRAKSKFLIMAEDGGDFAAILPASKLNPEQISKYASLFSSYFTQRAVPNKCEYRCYFVAGKHFIYKKSENPKFDKSVVGYENTEQTLDKKTAIAIEKLAEAHKLNYLCLDVIIDTEDRSYVVDINPYGQFPPYDYFPEPSQAAAEFLINYA